MDVVVLSRQATAMAAALGQVAAGPVQSATPAFPLAVAVGGITLVSLLAAAAVWMWVTYRSRRMPNEARLLHSMASMGFGVWSIDLATGKSWSSPRYDAIFGYASPPLQWTVPMFLDHVLAEDREAVEATLREADASASDAAVSVVFQCRIRRDDGAVRWIEAHGTRESKVQAGSMMFGVMHDITERQQIAAALQARESQLTLILENIEDVVYLIDVADDGFRFASVNPGFLAATGLTLAQVLGHRVEDVIPEPSLGMVLEHYAQAVESGQPVCWEEVTTYPAGTKFGEVMVAPVMDATGRCAQLVGTVHDITKRQGAEEQLHRLARYDALTGLPNRRFFYECMGKEAEVVKAQDLTVALLYLDLDRFKDVNDTFGHSIGDELLRQVAERILSCTRVRDTAGRLGGDEFGVIAMVSNESDDAATLAEKLIEQMQKPFLLAGHEVIVTPSIGIALCPADSCDTETLIKFADMAMYQAKAAGRNAYRFYTPKLNARLRNKLQLQADLRKAIDRGEFVLHYQPEIDIESGRWTGAEALLRWNRPRHGLVSPADFVPALEESGLIVPVGRWVIDAACRQLREWHDAGIDGVSVSVNVSAKQVMPSSPRHEGNHTPLGSESHEICEHVERCLRMHHIAPGSLELELTETALMSHAEKTVELLAGLKDLGVQILVDDFGTGYSSLAYLKRFPIDTLKIDREFINDLSTDPEDRAITRAIISLAHSLNLKVVAEGVETREQLAFLQEEHCDKAQGYYFARPMPAAELLARIHANGSGFNTL